MSCIIRNADNNDVGTLLLLIKELAECENLSDQVTATEQILAF